MVIDLPTEFDTNRTREHHIADHFTLHRNSNQLRWITAGEDIQSKLNAGGRIVLGPGVHNAGVLTINKEVVMSGVPGTQLQTSGIVANGGEAYLRLALRDLNIVGTGAGTGLRLDGCTAEIDRVSVSGFEIGLDIEFAIQTTVSSSRFGGSVNSLHVGGRANTTLLFLNSYFYGSYVAAKIDPDVTNITFNSCVFENCQRGIEADGVASLSLYSPYFEACYQEQIVVGENSMVSSFVMTNPVMMGHDNNNSEAHMCVFDNVRDVTWLNGYCVVEKATLIKTTAKTGNVFFVEPYNIIGSVRDIATPSTAIIRLRDGYMQCQQLRSDTWRIFQGYYLTPGDISIHSGENVALYSTPDGKVRIAGDTTDGLRHGLEIDDYSITLTRESDQTRWRYTIDDDGTLRTEQV